MKRFLSTILTVALAMSLGATAFAAAPDRFDGSWRAQLSEESWEAIRCTNAERAKEGLRPMSTFDQLHAAAQLRAVELKTAFDHTRPNGQSCMTALNDVGLDPYDFDRAGENIAIGYSSAASVVEGWMNSPGHRMNILTAPFTHIGLGCEGRGWTQMFLGICAPQLTGVTVGKSVYPMGTALEEMEGVVALRCEHGDSYLPLSPEMCSGYDAAQAGSQTVTVDYMGQSTSFPVTLQGTPQEAAAWELYRLGLFQGRGTLENGQPDFALDKTCTRQESLVMLLRLLGREGEITAADASAHPFRDVADWASRYVGFAYRSGIAQGTSGTTFSGGSVATVPQELTFVLRALGYESGKEFAWDSPWTLSDRIGLTSGEYGPSQQKQAVTRGEVALLCQSALDCQINGGSGTLREDLSQKGILGNLK